MSQLHAIIWSKVFFSFTFRFGDFFLGGSDFWNLVRKKFTALIGSIRLENCSIRRKSSFTWCLPELVETKLTKNVFFYQRKKNVFRNPIQTGNSQKILCWQNIVDLNVVWWKFISQLSNVRNTVCISVAVFFTKERKAYIGGAEWVLRMKIQGNSRNIKIHFNHKEKVILDKHYHDVKHSTCKKICMCFDRGNGEWKMANQLYFRTLCEFYLRVFHSILFPNPLIFTSSSFIWSAIII